MQFPLQEETLFTQENHCKQSDQFD